MQNREQQLEDRKKELENKERLIEEQASIIASYKAIVQNREQQLEDRKKDIEVNIKLIKQKEASIALLDEEVLFLKELAQSMKIKNRIKKIFGFYKVPLKKKFQANTYPLETEPLVSIIIPFKDKPELLKCVVESIINKTNYSHFEIIGISNNSQEEQTFKEMKRLEQIDKRVQFYQYNEPFNFSKINNYAINNYAKGEYIVFMNNDIEVISSLWIEALLSEALKEDVGAVGAKLYYENDTIQHAGVSLNANFAPIHIFHKQKRHSQEKRLNSVGQYLAVTAALAMLSREKFDLVGQFDENLSVAYNDVDLCFKLMKKGYKNIFTPYCEAYHYESLSRGYEDTPQKQERLLNEKNILMSKHKDILTAKDPFFSNEGK